MAGALFDAFNLLFGNGMTNSCKDFLDTMIGTGGSNYGALGNTLLSIVNDDFFFWLQTLTLGYFTAVFFFMDIIGMVQHDQVTMEKLINVFIKLVLVATLIINLPYIILYLFQFCQRFALLMREVSFNPKGISDSDSIITIKWWGNDSFPSWTDTLTDIVDDNGNSVGPLLANNYFEGKYGFGSGISAFFGSFKTFIRVIPCMIICMGAKIAGLFLITTNVVSLALKTVFSPIPVSQCFDEGTRSTGIRFLKGYVADALNFAGINAALNIASTISNALLISEIESIAKSSNLIAIVNNTVNINSMKQLNLLADSESIFVFCIIQIGAVGAMMGISKITSSLLG